MSVLTFQNYALFVISTLVLCVMNTEAVITGSSSLVNGKSDQRLQLVSPLSGPIPEWENVSASNHALYKRSIFSSLLTRIRDQMQRNRVVPDYHEVIPEPAIVADLDAAGAQLAKDTSDYSDQPTVFPPRTATICYMNPVSCFGRRRMMASKYNDLTKRRYQL